MYYIFVYLARNTLKLSLKQIKTVSELKKIPGRGLEEKYLLCPPSPHFLATPLGRGRMSLQDQFAVQRLCHLLVITFF